MDPTSAQGGRVARKRSNGPDGRQRRGNKVGKSDKRTKHVDIRYHFLRDMVDRGATDLEYCPTNQMLADLMTKPLLASRFKEIRAKMMVATGGLGKGRYVGGPTGHAEDNPDRNVDLSARK